MSIALQDTSLSEVSFTEEDFAGIVGLVYRASGITLGESKRDLVYGRLRKRLRTLGLDSFAAYRDLLAGPDGDGERVHLINALTTNLTGFFREAHHFAYLAEEVLPQRSRESRRLRIWSAGCSSGEEPYSIAMTLRDAVPDLCRWDARVLATDIDTEMVAYGAEGCYPLDRAAAIPPQMRRSHVQRLDEERVEMAPALKALISFRALNLLGPWPMRGPFDAIFCRNVVIYFDKPTQRALFDRFANIIAPGGYLFIGHSESLFRVSDRFEHLGRTIYRKLR